jgi:hypothetical protein
LYIVGNQFYEFEDSDRAIVFNFAQAVYADSDFISNITNYHFVNNRAGLRLVRSEAVIMPQEATRSFSLVLDFSALDGTVGNHSIETSDFLPQDSIVITRVWYVVNVILASSTTSATLGFSFPGASDYNIMGLTAIGTSGTVGMHETDIDGDFANFLLSSTSGDLRYNVGVEEITSGRVHLICEYINYS